jgi:hypothetical protein
MDIDDSLFIAVELADGYLSGGRKGFPAGGFFAWG